MRLLVGIFALTLLLSLQAEALAEEPRVIATIHLAEQKMVVMVGDREEYAWSVSTGKNGYETPRGIFIPYWLHEHHRSSIYGNAPMPYSVFFKGGFAIHGTTEVKRLGTRASHGCIRLLTENARIFFNLVQKYEMKNVQIVVD